MVVSQLQNKACFSSSVFPIKSATFLWSAYLCTAYLFLINLLRKLRSDQVVRVRNWGHSRSSKCLFFLSLLCWHNVSLFSELPESSLNQNVCQHLPRSDRKGFIICLHCSAAVSSGIAFLSWKTGEATVWLQAATCLCSGSSTWVPADRPDVCVPDWGEPWQLQSLPTDCGAETTSRPFSQTKSPVTVGSTKGIHTLRYLYIQYVCWKGGIKKKIHWHKVLVSAPSQHHLTPNMKMYMKTSKLQF